MKSKKKIKNNQNRGMHLKRAKRLFSKVTLVSWESSEVSGARTSFGTVNLAGVKKPLSQKEVNLLCTYHLDWIVCCRALCELNGEVWVESEIRAVRGVKINELAQEYEAMREKVLESVQVRHIVDLGWICKTFTDKEQIDSCIELELLDPITEERKRDWLAVQLAEEEP